MTLAGSTISNAVRYSMMKFCYANIIIAGPICSGKKSIAQSIAEFSALQNLVQSVTIFDQDSYYREYEELEDTKYDVKNIDKKSAFNTKKFVNDVRTFYEKGAVSVAEYNRRKWTRSWGIMQKSDENENKPSFILETKYKRRINIFVGPHAIELLTQRLGINNSYVNDYVVPYQIPEAICIYLNTDHQTCMKRREKEKLMFPENLYDVRNYKEYSRFIEEQTQKEIAIQKQVADIVINCK